MFSHTDCIHTEYQDACWHMFLCKFSIRVNGIPQMSHLNSSLCPIVVSHLKHICSRHCSHYSQGFVEEDCAKNQGWKLDLMSFPSVQISSLYVHCQQWYSRTRLDHLNFRLCAPLVSVVTFKLLLFFNNILSSISFPMLQTRSLYRDFFRKL